LNAPVRPRLELPEELVYWLTRSSRARLCALLALTLALDEPTSAEFHELAAALDGHHVDPEHLGPAAQRLLQLIQDGPLERAVSRLLRAGVCKETIADILYPPLINP
jgi:hypothetical protein